MAHKMKQQQSDSLGKIIQNTIQSKQHKRADNSIPQINDVKKPKLNYEDLKKHLIREYQQQKNMMKNQIAKPEDVLVLSGGKKNKIMIQQQYQRKLQ